MKYSDKLKDPRWQKKRLEVFERDGWCCQCCGDSESPLNVHHKYYNKNKNPWEYQLEELMTLCDQCHEVEYNDRYGDEKDLLVMIKAAGFLSNDVHILAEAFHSICMLYPPNVTAGIIHHAFKTREIIEYISNKYFESIKVKTV
jgi:hypothetical protein